MCVIYRTIATAFLCGIVLGCSKPEAVKPEPAKPTATAAAPIAAPVATPIVASTPKPTASAPEAASLPAGEPPLGTPVLKKSTAAEDLKVVQDVLAKILKIKPEAVDPKSTLSTLKASNLDMADAVMEIEEKLKIAIPKSALQKAADTDMPYEVIEKLTVAKFAEVVTTIRAKQ
ncbi:MAG: hypothetical protein K8U03_25500 [Planctomycetia bacterium]|nr:hypothetical protein [Planctomycetia bacterium]